MNCIILNTCAMCKKYLYMMSILICLLFVNFSAFYVDLVVVVCNNQGKPIVGTVVMIHESGTQDYLRVNTDKFGEACFAVAAFSHCDIFVPGLSMALLPVTSIMIPSNCNEIRVTVSPTVWSDSYTSLNYLVELLQLCAILPENKLIMID